MRRLTEAQNIDSPTSDYPKGRARNRTESPLTAGTIFSEELMGDAIQLFQKLVTDAEITENGTPDNETNGYQLLEALVAKVVKETNTVKRESVNITATNGVTVDSSVAYVATSGGIISFQIQSTLTVPSGGGVFYLNTDISAKNAIVSQLAFAVVDYAEVVPLSLTGIDPIIFILTLTEGTHSVDISGTVLTSF